MIKSREEILSNLTVYRGFTHEELQHRADKHREKYLQACRNQGQHDPSKEQLDRWFGVDEFELEEE